MVNVRKTALIKNIASVLVVPLVFAVFLFVVYAVNHDHDKERERLKSELRNIDEYVLVDVHYGSGISQSHCYGYISDSDYSAFINNESNKNIIIEHPYENERIVLTSKSINFIKVVSEDDVINYYDYYYRKK